MKEMSYWELIKKYPEFETTGTQQINDQLARWIARKWLTKKGRLIDLGCGRGRTVKAFEKLGFECKGCDSDPIEDWIDKVDLNKDKLPYPDNSFDYVFSKHVIQYLKNPSNMLSEAWRILKPGGKMLAITHEHPDSLSIIPNVYTKRKLKKQILSHHFEFIEMESYNQIPIIWKYSLLSFDLGLYSLPITKKVKIPNLLPRIMNIFYWRLPTLVIVCSKSDVELPMLEVR